MSNLFEFDALLLSAGFGTRLRPLTDVLPKALMPIHGRPILEFWLKALLKEQIDSVSGLRAQANSVLVNTHYKAHLVQRYLAASTYGASVKVLHEEVLLGTGGTLLSAKKHFGERPIMLVHADNLSVFNTAAFMSAHLKRPSGCEITMMTFETDSPSSCGIVEIDSSGVVFHFHEKVARPPGKLANAAIYIIEPSILASLEQLKKDVIDFSLDVIPSFLGKIFTFHNGIYHRDIGSVETWLLAQLELALLNSSSASDDNYMELFLSNEHELLKSMAGAITLGIREP